MSGKFYKLTMNDVPLAGKTVLVRADYNVPLTADGKVADDYRIRMSVPTIKKLIADECRIVIISHLGRPEGEVNSKYSLAPVAARLGELLGQSVEFVDDCIGQKVFMSVKNAAKGSVTLLENLRFHPEEEANDADFARQLAKQSRAEYFVQDGFGVVHRAHASTSAITQFLPSVSGLLLEREYMTITGAMKTPERPLVAVLGGAKVSDKISVIEALVDVADTIIVGGAMANTFLAHRGISVGASKVEADQGPVIDAIYQKVAAKVGAERADSFLVLPVDIGAGGSTEQNATRQDVPVAAIPERLMALDLGPETTKLIESIVKRAHTVIWNGTLGYAEVPAFATSSAALAQVLADKKGEITSVIGGGDTADFVIHWDSNHGASFSHVSTGGGASLELMAGEKLPGIEALLDANK
jgi:phosphoglycerate kinase